MILLKNSKNTQTFYIAKKTGIEKGQLYIGSYSKVEADALFQPKGDYITADEYNNKINELEATIQELQSKLANSGK